MDTARMQARKVFFELTNACNFRCDFCPIEESTRATRRMEWELYTKGIDEIAAQGIADTVGFHILGEPLLYPRLAEAVGYATERGLKTEINTNGSLLTAERVESLLAAGLSQLIISVQTVGEEAFAGRGAGMSYTTYYRRVLDTVSQIAAAATATEVMLCFMDTTTRRFFDIDKRLRLGPETDAVGHALPAFAHDLYGAIGRTVSRGEVQAALHRLNLREPRVVCLDERVSIYVQPLADWGNAFTARQVHPARWGACGYALANVGVLNTGEVTICCADYDGRTSLGNLHTSSLSELLASGQAQGIREGFRHNRVVHPYCQHCLGSPNRVKAVFKGLASIYLFKWRGFEPSRVQRVALLIAPEKTHAGIHGLRAQSGQTH